VSQSMIMKVSPVLRIFFTLIRLHDFGCQAVEGSPELGGKERRRPC
jgi:hypothetical protein